jgi:hypothetical protein
MPINPPFNLISQLAGMQANIQSPLVALSNAIAQVGQGYFDKLAMNKQAEQQKQQQRFQIVKEMFGDYVPYRRSSSTGGKQTPTPAPIPTPTPTPDNTNVIQNLFNPNAVNQSRPNVSPGIFAPAFTLVPAPIPTLAPAPAPAPVPNTVTKDDVTKDIISKGLTNEVAKPPVNDEIYASGVPSSQLSQLLGFPVGDPDTVWVHPKRLELASKEGLYDEKLDLMRKTFEERTKLQTKQQQDRLTLEEKRLDIFKKKEEEKHKNKKLFEEIKVANANKMQDKRTIDRIIDSAQDAIINLAKIKAESILPGEANEYLEPAAFIHKLTSYVNINPNIDAETKRKILQNAMESSGITKYEKLYNFYKETYTRILAEPNDPGIEQRINRLLEVKKAKLEDPEFIMFRELIENWPEPTEK